MKKNVMMRVASALLVAVLMTTCAISGTFAKYTSKTTTSDNARVAKWGWGDTSISIDLFDGEYEDQVQSLYGDNVIAPGTGKTATLVWQPAYGFQPEVDYTISFAVDADIDAGIEAQLVWTLNIDGTETDFDSFADLEAELEAKVYAFEAAAAVATFNIQIGWEWAFEDGSDDADTALGSASTLADLEIEITLTATQIGD